MGDPSVIVYQKLSSEFENLEFVVNWKQNLQQLKYDNAGDQLREYVRMYSCEELELMGLPHIKEILEWYDINNMDQSMENLDLFLVTKDLSERQINMFVERMERYLDRLKE